MVVGRSHGGPLQQWYFKASKVKYLLFLFQFQLLFPLECRNPYYEWQQRMVLDNNRDSKVKDSKFCGCKKASEITTELLTPSGGGLTLTTVTENSR